MKQNKTKTIPGASRFFQGIVAAIPILLAVALVQGADYSGTVLADGPLAYYRFGDDTSRSPINRNSGSLGAGGNATNDLPTGVVHPFPGALAGDGNRSVFFDFSTRTEIPWNAALNPLNNQPFTIEAWFYPASDQINGGQCPINNRYAPSGADRQGWVFFQRAPNLDYTGKPGFEGVGWNCRMYRGSAGSSGLDVVSQVPYEIGKWTHVVVVYDPVDPVTNATLTIYVNGVAANTNTWTGGGTGTDPGYVANSNDHADAASAIAIGNYNNTAGTSLNPYFGAVDEFAFYSAKLTSAQILAHYQNGTNANRSTPYYNLIKSHNPVAYLRLDDIAPGSDSAINMGDLRSSGNATHTAEVRHPAPSALAGRTDDSAAAYHYRNGSSTTTIPWTAANNPNAGIPFTFETWLRPMSDKQGGQAAFNNRWVGGTGRTGWVIFQRDPNLSYGSIPGTEGHGWEFRMYSGSGNGGQDVRTETDYTVGQWGHFVVTWEPQTDNGDPAVNGNNQWQGVLTAYFNGVAVSSNTAALYAANLETPEDLGAPADFAIGSYNAKSGLGNNAFEGDIDEVAIYTNYVLTAAQILDHYQAGTNSRPATNYETLVLTAPYDGAGTQRLGPPTYLRFNDPARYPASNSGTLGYVADGNLILTTNQAAGPKAPPYAGFDSQNAGVPLDGLKSWTSLNNPPGLNVSGQVTLEAWVKPGATQGESARIISHGPPTLSAFVSDPLPETNASVLSGSEVFLRIDGTGANYVVGSSDGTNTYSASYAVPAGDLGSSSWIHLVGTYDGANWRLYRNGAPVGTSAAAVGALPVSNGDWAIGATGNGWSNNFAGSVDEVAIYNRALTPSQIQAHYTAGQAQGWRLAGISGAQTDDTQSTPGVYDHPDHTLFEISLSNGAVSSLFQLPWVNDSQAMGYCPTNGLVYHTGGSEAYSNNPLRNGHDQGQPDVQGVGYQDSQFMESVNLATRQMIGVFNADPCPNPDPTLPCFGLPAPIPIWQLPAYRRDSTMTDGTNRVTGPNEYHAVRGLAWSSARNCFYVSDELGIFTLTTTGDSIKLTNRPAFTIPSDTGPLTADNDAKAIAFVTVTNVTKLWVGSRMDSQPSGNTNGWIMEVDPESGVVLGQLALKYPPGGADAGGPLPGDFGGLLGLAQHPVTGVLYGIRKTDDAFARELITINPVTGDTTLVGSIGMHITSLAFVPSSTPSPLQIQTVVRNGSNLTITWTTGTGPYQVQRRATLSGGTWVNEGAPTATTSATVSITGNEGYFRVQSQ